MRFNLLSFITATLCFSLVAAKNANHLHGKTECILYASGADDAPYFVRAMEECATVNIPKSTTLNIETRLNMTGLRDKHIVSPSLDLLHQHERKLKCVIQ